MNAVAHHGRAVRTCPESVMALFGDDRSPDGAKRNPGWAFAPCTGACRAGRLFPDYASLHPGYKLHILIHRAPGNNCPCDAPRQPRLVKRGVLALRLEFRPVEHPWGVQVEYHHVGGAART